MRQQQAILIRAVVRYLSGLPVPAKHAVPLTCSLALHGSWGHFFSGMTVAFSSSQTLFRLLFCLGSCASWISCSAWPLEAREPLNKSQKKTPLPRPSAASPGMLHRPAAYVLRRLISRNAASYGGNTGLGTWKQKWLHGSNLSILHSSRV